jgi:ABC-2 type transport system ATP-binding protein
MYTYIMLVAKGLKKSFGHIVALDGLDLTVRPGEVLGLVGENGAGKTTFARAVAGLVSLDAGHVSVAGVDTVREPRRARALLGWAPQELALYPTTTVRENLLVFGGLGGLRRGDASQRAAELAVALELTGILDRLVCDLSGGQQRRVQAATAMMHQPAVLLLDEPTVGADPITRQAVLSIVRSIAEAGSAVVYTTHYLPELEVLNASIAVVKAGRVIARGSRAELLASVPGCAVLRYDGTPPMLTSHVSGGTTIQVAGSEVTITAIDPAGCVAALLARHAENASRLRSIELSPPTLDDLYRQLLQPMRRYHGI